MTNLETIEKLNDALNQLIDAYEALQEKYDATVEKLEVQIEKNRELEYQLSDLSTTTHKQENKMDSMLGKIQKLLTAQKEPAEDSYKEEFNDSILDIKLDSNDDLLVELPKAEKLEEKATKIDFGRMESLLNGLNSK